MRQGKDGVTFSPSFPKGSRALIAFPYSSAKRNKYVATGYESGFIDNYNNPGNLRDALGTIRWHNTFNYWNNFTTVG